MNQPQKNHACPYKGLQPFTADDRDYFFGREDEIDVATSNLKVAPLTVLYGASGVGKTSVLMAGVVSRIQSEKEAAAIFFRDWQNAEFVSALRQETLSAIESVTGEKIEIPKKDSFADFLMECTKVFPAPLLFIFDQFEEYFLYHGSTSNQTRSDQTKSNFDVELARAINRRDLRANFLLSLREDGLSKLDRLQTRIPDLLGNLIRLDHLKADSARVAIRKPLLVYNSRSGEAPVKIEKGLVEKLLSQVQTGHVMMSGSAPADAQINRDDTGRIETSFLQLVLERLWLTETARWQTEPEAETHWLREQTLDDLKGAAHIVRTHLDDVLASLEDLAREQNISISSQEALPLIAEIFRFLVTSSETKIAHTANDLASFAELEPSQLGLLTDVLNLLALPKVRILRKVDPPPGTSSGERYEIYHDVLGPAIREWRNRFMSEQAEARARAEAETLLARQLAEAEQNALAARREQEKLLAQQRQEAEQKAMVAQLAQATALADAERKRAAAEGQRAELEFARGKEQAKAARRFRVLAVAMALLFLLSVAASVFAVRQSRLATHQAQEAGLLRRYAEDQAVEARSQRKYAEDQAEEARLQRTYAEAQAKEAGRARAEAVVKAEEARVARDKAEMESRRAENERLNAVAAKAEAEAARENENAYRRALDLSRREATKAKALEDLKTVLTTFRRSGNAYATKDVILSLGDINAELNDDKAAQSNYDEAISLSSTTAEKAWMLTRIGDTYRELPLWWSSRPREKAKDYYASALKIYEDAGDQALTAAALILLGHASVDLALAQPPSPTTPNGSGQPPPVNESFEEAMRYFDRAVNIYRQRDDNQGEAMALWNAGFAAEKLTTAEGREKARNYYTQAIPKYEQVGDRKNQIAIFRHLLNLSYQSEDLDKRIDYLVKMVRLYGELNDTAGAVSAAQELGWSFAMIDPAKNPEPAKRGPEVLALLRGLLATVGPQKDQNTLSVTMNVARVSEVLKDWPSAIRAYEELLELTENSKDVSGQNFSLQALLKISSQVADTDRTQRYLRKSETLISQMPKDEKRLYALVSFGFAALDVNAPEAAKKAYDEAIGLARGLDNSYFEVDTLRNAGNGFANHDLMDTAMSYFNTLRSLFHDRNQPYGEASVFEDLGRHYDRKNASEKAIEYYKQAADLYHQANALDVEARLLRLISENYKTLGDETKAQDYKRRADALAPVPSPSPCSTPAPRPL